MSRLLFVRHGQTVWNTQHRMQGQKDSPLTATGRELARRLGVRLGNTHIDGVFYSPLKRADDTAHILACGRDVPLYPDERLKELDLGRWEGEDMRLMEQRYPIDFEWFWLDPNRYMDIRGGETYDHLLARTRDFLSDVGGREGTYVAVTHAIALRSVRQNALGLSTADSRVSMPSCCLSEIDVNDGKFDLKLFGDRYHHDDTIADWWCGSTKPISVLPAGSIVTRIRSLAEALSFAPEHLTVNVDSTLTHDGRLSGYLYRICEPLRIGDVIEENSTMPLTYEFRTTRDLKVELSKQTRAGDALDIPADNPELTLNV